MVFLNTIKLSVCNHCCSTIVPCAWKSRFKPLSVISTVDMTAEHGFIRQPHGGLRHHVRSKSKSGDDIGAWFLVSVIQNEVVLGETSNILHVCKSRCLQECQFG